jgi:hypothetical protein
MPEIKNQFTGGKMNKDLDERLVPNGQYRDAMNIQVATSEGSAVGTVQNILGNELILNIAINPNSRVVGSIADEKNDTLYWFVKEYGNCQVPNLNRDMIFQRKNGIVKLVFNDMKCFGKPGYTYVLNEGVLKFPDRTITGINIIDDLLFWTDGETEPKKINISRSIQGTDQTGTIATKIINPDRDINLASNIFAKEEHVTVIKRPPSKAPTLGVSTVIREGLLDGTITITDDSNTTSGAGIFTSAVNGTITQINIDAVSGVHPNFQPGDTLRLVNDLEDFDNNNYDLRVKIISIDAGGGAASFTTYTVKVESISELSGQSAIAGTTTWFVELEDYTALFERKLTRFATRYKYIDNEYSTFSPFTSVAFFPGEFNYEPIKAYNEAMFNELKSLVITDFVQHDIPEDVVQVDILVKNDTSPSIYLLKSIFPKAVPIETTPPTLENEWNSIGSVDPSTIAPGLTLDLSKTNKGAFKVSSENMMGVLESNQLLRAWDNVPLNALAQELSGNRVIYANYTISHNLIDYTSVASGEPLTADINVLTLARSIDTIKHIGSRSIKSLRDYSIGIVWGDKYGRETPIMTSSGGSINVPKSEASNSNYFNTSLKKSPDWASYYRFYVKETSNEYYNLAVDRIYDAADGNIWVSFPSVDRNKVDDDTYLILKKGADANTIVTEKARYKIIAISNEAPEYIKTTYEVVARTSTDDSRPVNSWELYGGDITNLNSLPSGGKNPPTPGMKGFSIDRTSWAGDYDSSGSTRAMGLPPLCTEVLDGVSTGVIGLFEEVIANATGAAADQFYVSFSQEIVPLPTTSGGTATGIPTIIKSRKYKVVGVRHDNDGDSGDQFYYVNLDSPILTDDAWVTNNFPGNTPGQASPLTADNIHITFWKKTVINKPEFDGRFFVKLLNDTSIEDNLFAPNIISSNLQSSGSVRPFKLAPSTGPNTEGENHNIWTGGGGANALMNKDHWEEALKFGESTGKSGWFIDAAPFASIQLGDETNGKLDYRRWLKEDGTSYTSGETWGWDGEVTNSYTEPPSTDEGVVAVFDIDGINYSSSKVNTGTNANEEYQAWCGDCVCYLCGQWDTNYGNTNYGGDGRSTGQVGMKGIFTRNGLNYMDLSFSGVGPTEPASDTSTADGSYGNLKDQKHKLDWRVGDPNNLDTDEESAVTDNLFVGSMFQVFGDSSSVIYRITQVNKFLLFNYHGVKTSEPRTRVHNCSVYYPPILACAPGFVANDNAFMNQNGLDCASMHQARNRRVTYRIRYEMIPELSPDGTPATIAIDETTAGFDANNEPGIPVDGTTSMLISFLSTFTSEEQAKISKNPAIFETEPKEDIDLDIFYEASNNQAIFPITNDNKYVYLPIGSTIVPPNSSFPNGIFVSGWGDIIPSDIALGYGTIYISQPINLTQALTLLPGIKFMREDGSFATATPAPVPGIIDSFGNMIGFVIKPINEVGLSWHNCWSFNNGVESNRIGDTYNKPFLSNGVVVSTTSTDLYKEDHRKYGLIYSGLYNANAQLNNLNQFIQAEKITKDINPTYGSIQKLYAGWGEGGDLIALCEDRVLRILANKDALYNADGNSQLTSTDRVLGQTIPYSGEYGISTNPESFANESYRAYFTDKVRGAVMRLSMDGLTPISDAGMKDWFRDNLKLNDQLIGSYDDKREEYNLTLKGYISDYHSCENVYTITYREEVKGWVSFKSFFPENAISCANEYYTFLNGQLYQHHIETVDRNTFYGGYWSSTFTAILNAEPGAVKVFNTLNYEGSQSKIDQFVSQLTPLLFQPTVTYSDQDIYNLSGKRGWYVCDISTDMEVGYISEFIGKENKWFNNINRCIDANLPQADTSDFTFQGIGVTTSISAPVVNGCTDPAALNYDLAANVDDGSCTYENKT